MFVYSRNFGGAKYVDTPRQQTAPRPEAVPVEQPVATSAKITKTIASEAQSGPANKTGEQRTLLIYTDLPL
jgi:hypothetical protein